MRRLHELVSRLLGCNDLQIALQEVLDATLVLMEVDKSYVQLLKPETRELRIVAHRGFPQEFLDTFQNPAVEPSAVFASAAQRGERVIIEDVQTDPSPASQRAIAASAGFRAVQSTPVMSRKGKLLGILATHFRTPHRPSERGTSDG